jgi:phospholipid/cholesterol/gamma-HCH transport system permease protein
LSLKESSADSRGDLRMGAESFDRADGVTELRLSGRLTLTEASEVRSRNQGLDAAKCQRVILDFTRVESLDGSAAAILLDAVSSLTARGLETQIFGAQGQTLAMLELYRQQGTTPTTKPEHSIGLLDDLGRATAKAAHSLREILGFLGDLVASIIVAVRRPSSVNLRDVGPLIERTGADGVFVVGITCLLLGFIMAFQSAIQLKPFAATHLVADLVALALTRELAPLMTAFVVAGRSGAAFAAEIGTMKVSEEIDALLTLGLPPINFLVIPRVLALLVALPLLTLFADLMGLTGGYVVGVTWLDITSTSYLAETRGALTLPDVLLGVWKSIAFAVAISLISCQRGLETSGGAQGVGQSTTRAVVTILFSLVLIDAVFAVFSNVFSG